MKLTGELKEKVEKAESAAEAKDIIAEAGVELTDEEVENVAGGILPRTVRRPTTTKPTGGVVGSTGYGGNTGYGHVHKGVEDSSKPV